VLLPEGLPQQHRNDDYDAYQDEHLLKSVLINVNHCWRLVRLPCALRQPSGHWAGSAARPIEATYPAQHQRRSFLPFGISSYHDWSAPCPHAVRAFFCPTPTSTAAPPRRPSSITKTNLSLTIAALRLSSMLRKPAVVGAGLIHDNAGMIGRKASKEARCIEHCF
jgi:hypothetical protein